MFRTKTINFKDNIKKRVFKVVLLSTKKLFNQ